MLRQRKQLVCEYAAATYFLVTITSISNLVPFF